MTQQDIFLFCPLCDCRVHFENWSKHMYLQHGESVDSDLKLFLNQGASDDWAACPECGERMKTKSLRRHLRKVHGLEKLSEQRALMAAPESAALSSDSSSSR